MSVSFETPDSLWLFYEHQEDTAGIRERERRAAETVEEASDWQPGHNMTRREEQRKRKNKEVTDCQK
ncbi:hypothetical protein TNCV_4567681 [Trichonephila clavipes]|nr:hypothetical protein TNCV_4567681 [Trichonephila clavipes]